MNNGASPPVQVLRHLISVAGWCLLPEPRDRSHPTDQPFWCETNAPREPLDRGLGTS
jgi:hypothetical protein